MYEVAFDTLRIVFQFSHFRDNRGQALGYIKVWTTRRDGAGQGHSGQTFSKVLTSYVNNQFIHNNQEDFDAYACAAGERHWWGAKEW